MVTRHVRSVVAFGVAGGGTRCPATEEASLGVVSGEQLATRRTAPLRGRSWSRDRAVFASCLADGRGRGRGRGTVLCWHRASLTVAVALAGCAARTVFA